MTYVWLALVAASLPYRSCTRPAYRSGMRSSTRSPGRSLPGGLDKNMVSTHRARHDGLCVCSASPRSSVRERSPTRRWPRRHAVRSLRRETGGSIETHNRRLCKGAPNHRTTVHLLRRSPISLLMTGRGRGRMTGMNRIRSPAGS